MAISLFKLLLEVQSSFPDDTQLLVMTGVMDGKSLSNIATELAIKVKDAKNILATGMRRANVNNLYELIVWGLRTGIIKDEPKTDLKNKIQPPVGSYEAHPTWLRVLDAIISGYNDVEIEQHAGVSRDSLKYYKKHINDTFNLGGSRARLIRFGFQLLNPIKPPLSMSGNRPFRPWTGSTTSLMTIPKTGTGSRINPEDTITNKTKLFHALDFLKVVGNQSQKKNPWDMLELAKQRRDDEIRRLHPIANKHPETPEVKMAAKQLAIVNAAWDRIRILFARKGYVLPGDEELLRREKRIFVPHGKK